MKIVKECVFFEFHNDNLFFVDLARSFILSNNFFKFDCEISNLMFSLFVPINL